MKYVEDKINREQISFALMSFDDLVAADSPARVIDAFVEHLDLTSCTRNDLQEVGRPAYHPKVMMKIYLYGYFNGIRTSRKLEREVKRNTELMWLTNGLTPNNRTICSFRKDNKEAIIFAFKQFSLLCDSLDLIGKEIVAIDGSKFRASNSRKKNYTQNKVLKLIKRYEENAKKYIQLLEENNCPEDEYTQAVVKLDEINKKIEDLLNLKKEIDENGAISITDPDSKHMSVSNNGTDIAYNVQTAVDEKHHLIVATDVVTTPQDNGQLAPMSHLVKKELAVDKITVLADKGYYNGECLKYCQENNINAIISKQKIGSFTGNPEYSKDKFKYDKEKDVFICPQGHELNCVSSKTSKQITYKTKECMNCPCKELCTTNKRGREIKNNKYFEVYEKANKNFNENIELYKERQKIVEHPFGTIKRTLGYTYFLTRRLDNVKNETYLHCLTYNLIRVINIMGIPPLLSVLKQKIVEKYGVANAIFVLLLGFNWKIKSIL